MKLGLEALITEAQLLTDSLIPIILLQHGLKAPIKGPDGSWIVIADPDDVSATIEKAAQHATPNLGGVLAPKFDSRLVVVDIDGAAGSEKAKELGVSRGSAVWIVRTGRGNLHIYYFWDSTQAPPERRVKAGKLPIDLLSNGYVVLPPSNTYREPKGGGPYHWVKGHSPADIPLSELDPPPTNLTKWWQELAATCGEGALGQPTPETEQPPGRRQAWRLRAGAIPEGSRNDTLTRIAGWLRLYHSAPEVEALLLSINDGRCHPPLNPKEVQQIVKSIAKYPQPGVNGHPRAAVPRYVREEQNDA